MKRLLSQKVLSEPVFSVALFRGNEAEINLGPELLDSSDFGSAADWNEGNGWSIVGGIANASPGNATHLTQSGKLVLGKTYRIVLNILTADPEGFTVRAGNGNPTSPRYGPGIHVLDQVCSGNTTFYVYKTATALGSIASVSCKEILT